MVTFDPNSTKGINGYADSSRFPGEDESKAIRRRVKMHEFLMTGGVLLGEEPKTRKPIYSEPIDPLTVAELHPECPWHGVDRDGTRCTAWVEIIEGRGTGEVVEPTLAELRGRTHEDLAEMRTKIRVARDQQDSFFRNSDAPGENPRTEPPMALSPKPGGYPWDKKSPSFSGSQHRSAERYIEPVEDARDTAIEHLGEEIPDTIEVDGDEGEEGDE